ncbi:hypothetical protein PR048_031020 [Dryococelus australis]|uniref:Uncharacterized protein n=1 Tax=Dryococelus australis TaxID=614101 RepID=A0ABQ9G711_9NEOP|nr:hypothetical protein PR048_031020 [Dryococelus australis]
MVQRKRTEPLWIMSPGSRSGHSLPLPRPSSRRTLSESCREGPLKNLTELRGRSPPTTAVQARSPAGLLPDFRMWESCWTMPLARGFYRGTPVSPALTFQRHSIIGSHFMSGYDGHLRVPAGNPVLSLCSCHTRVTPVSPALAFQRRSIVASHFTLCPGMTGTYGSQLGSPSLGGVGNLASVKPNVQDGGQSVAHLLKAMSHYQLVERAQTPSSWTGEESLFRTDGRFVDSISGRKRIAATVDQNRELNGDNGGGLASSLGKKVQGFGLRAGILFPFISPLSSFLWGVFIHAGDNCGLPSAPSDKAAVSGLTSYRSTMRAAAIYLFLTRRYQHMVAEWLACSPPNKAIRVQSPSGSLRIFASGNRAGRCRWSASFLGDLSPSTIILILALLHAHLNYPYRLSRPRSGHSFEMMSLEVYPASSAQREPIRNNDDSTHVDGRMDHVASLRVRDRKKTAVAQEQAHGRLCVLLAAVVSFPTALLLDQYYLSGGVSLGVEVTVMCPLAAPPPQSLLRDSHGLDTMRRIVARPGAIQLLDKDRVIVLCGVARTGCELPLCLVRHLWGMTNLDPPTRTGRHARCLIVPPYLRGSREMIDSGETWLASQPLLLPLLEKPTVVRLLVSHQDELGSISGGVAPDDATVRRVFSGSPVPPALSFRRWSLIGSQRAAQISPLTPVIMAGRFRFAVYQVCLSSPVEGAEGWYTLALAFLRAWLGFSHRCVPAGGALRLPTKPDTPGEKNDALWAALHTPSVGVVTADTLPVPSPCYLPYHRHTPRTVRSPRYLPYHRHTPRTVRSPRYLPYHRHTASAVTLLPSLPQTHSTYSTLASLPSLPQTHSTYSTLASLPSLPQTHCQCRHPATFLTTDTLPVPSPFYLPYHRHTVSAVTLLPSLPQTHCQCRHPATFLTTDTLPVPSPCYLPYHRHTPRTVRSPRYLPYHMHTPGMVTPLPSLLPTNIPGMITSLPSLLPANIPGIVPSLSSLLAAHFRYGYLILKADHDKIGSKIDTENCCTIRVQSWTADRDEVHFEPPKLAVRNLDPRSVAIVHKLRIFGRLLTSRPEGEVRIFGRLLTSRPEDEVRIFGLLLTSRPEGEVRIFGRLLTSRPEDEVRIFGRLLTSRPEGEVSSPIPLLEKSAGEEWRGVRNFLDLLPQPTTLSIPGEESSVFVATIRLTCRHRAKSGVAKDMSGEN